MSAEQNVTEAPVPEIQAAGDGPNNGSGGFELDEDGQRIPHGMGQSKSSRRRRRKRKSKAAPEAGGANPAGASAEGFDPELGGMLQAIPVLPGESLALAQNPAARQANGNGNGNGRSFQAAAASPQSNGNGQPNGANNGQQNGAQPAPGTKRWKKKFRDRDRQRGPEAAGQGNGNGQAANGAYAGNGATQRGPDTHQPGNSSGNFKRKGGFGQGGGKQQRSAPRGFVGPMDHSYRAVNGNVFDAGQSTTEISSNGRGRSAFHGDSQPIDYSQGRAIPIAPDAPTRIYFFIEDLFLTAKISETARKLGVKVAFIKNDKEAIAALVGGEPDELPGLIVLDLNNANAKPLTLIPKLKTKLKKHTSIIGFLSHLQGDLKAKAVEAGCDTVMPRAAFSQNLPNLLRRYGIEEIEETNYNQ
jgi:hypothetical protein